MMHGEYNVKFENNVYPATYPLFQTTYTLLNTNLLIEEDAEREGSCLSMTFILEIQGHAKRVRKFLEL
jgi:hypothetical protein